MSLAHQLRSLGVPANGVLMVHASMRKVGGRAEVLLDALMESLGELGTMLMVLAADPDDPFDPLQSPVDVEDMGVLAEVFRNREGVRVNDHPADRFAALGPRAAELIDDPPLHDYHGPTSPMHRLAACGGHVLRLGSNIDTLTLTHWAEYVARVPNKRRVRRSYVMADGRTLSIDSLDDNLGIVDWPKGDYFSNR